MQAKPQSYRPHPSKIQHRYHGLTMGGNMQEDVSIQQKPGLLKLPRCMFSKVTKEGFTECINCVNSRYLAFGNSREMWRVLHSGNFILYKDCLYGNQIVGPAATTVGVSLYKDCFYSSLYITYKSHIFTLFPHHGEQLFICDVIFNVQKLLPSSQLLPSICHSGHE